MCYFNGKTNAPQWREVSVASHLPDELKKLSELAYNLWWSWHPEAMALYKELDPQLWKESERNPVLFLERVNYQSLEEKAADETYLQKMEDIYAKFRQYVETSPDDNRPSVAYFSMEYGLNKVLKIYSGGLGILAGDYLKEASDSNVDMCAVGLLYRYGYFDQSLTMDGQQTARYEAQEFGMLPIEKVLGKDGKQLVIHVPYTDYFVVHANVWKVNVGRIPLYLLDTDHEYNSEYDRPITHHLYGGDNENRLKQEILLGIGGMMLLKKLGIKKDVYHCNEGHAALINLQRLCDYMTEEKLDFAEAMELVRSSSLYTVHTPVPAGHDYFDEALFRKYMDRYPERLGISWDDLMGLGRNDPENHGEQFCMSVFACKTSQEVNGVSKLHSEVSQRMFAPIWKGYFPEENHVGYVTNGVHLPTWCATEWKELFQKYFGTDFWKDQSNPDYWKNIYKVDDEEIWQLRIRMKRKLMDYLKHKCATDWLRSQTDPALAVAIAEKFNPEALLVGFGRRFATYKRAYLLFSNEQRLAQLVNNPDRPIQFIFTGKAHPNDGAGQELIKRIVELSRRPEFIGKIIFVENYDMELARRLVSGVDVWLNTPTRLAEASGTSGEKALMNGVLNFSVLDGWWYEGYREGAGWALPAESAYQNGQHQDQLDASAIYYIFEHVILPLYYDRGDKDYSGAWIGYIKNSIAKIAPHYTMKRQLDDYYEKFYNRLAIRHNSLTCNGNALAKKLVSWKKAVAARWDEIEVVQVETNEGLNARIEAGKEYDVAVVLDEKGLDDAVGVECVAIHTENGRESVYSVIPLGLARREDNLYTFRASIGVSNAGSFKLAFRMYPKNEHLPHRQDFCYVRWL